MLLLCIIDCLTRNNRNAADRLWPLPVAEQAGPIATGKRQSATASPHQVEPKATSTASVRHSMLKYVDLPTYV